MKRMRSILTHLNRRLVEIGALGDRLNLPVYLVGGAVRDLLLGKESLDWDIVVVGDPAPLVERLAKEWKAELLAHERFGTFVLGLPDGQHVDFVTARKESYPEPGHLPVVEFSGLRDDLFRRDFTMNALALALNDRGERGRIVDLYGGLEDLEKNELRILHAKSFQDDPTRIFRLSRFAGRGFGIEVETERRAKRDRRYVGRISGERVREEILQILAEKDPVPALRLLAKWEILRKVFPGLKLEATADGLRRAKSLAERLHVIFSGFGPKRRERVQESLKLPRELKRELREMEKEPEPVPVLTGNDLIAMGYKPGPLFGKIMQSLAKKGIRDREQARRYVFDKFPQKI